MNLIREIARKSAPKLMEELPSIIDPFVSNAIAEEIAKKCRTELGPTPHEMLHGSGQKCRALLGAPIEVMSKKEALRLAIIATDAIDALENMAHSNGFRFVRDM